MGLLNKASVLLIWILLSLGSTFVYAFNQSGFSSPFEGYYAPSGSTSSHVRQRIVYEEKPSHDSFWFSMIKAAIVVFLSVLLLIISIFTIYIDLLAPLFFSNIESLTLSMWQYFLHDFVWLWYWQAANILGKSLGLLLGFSLFVSGFLYAKFWYFG